MYSFFEGAVILDYFHWLRDKPSCIPSHLTISRQGCCNFREFATDVMTVGGGRLSEFEYVGGSGWMVVGFVFQYCLTLIIMLLWVVV